MLINTYPFIASSELPSCLLFIRWLLWQYWSPDLQCPRNKTSYLDDYQQLHTRSHEEATIPMRIAVAHKNFREGHESMPDLTRPSSKNFGKHWTVPQEYTIHYHRVQNRSLLSNSGSWALGLAREKSTRWKRPSYQACRELKNLRYRNGWNSTPLYPTLKLF